MYDLDSNNDLTMTNRKIAIITVVKNDDERLQRTKNSVLEQRIGETILHHVIIKNTDQLGHGLYSILSEHTPFHKETVINLNDNGIYMAMNYGLALSKAKYCLFLNAGDTFLTKNSMKQLLGIDELSETGSKSSYYFPFFYDKPTLNNCYDLVGFSNLTAAHKNGMLICQQSILFNRSILIHIGGFDQSFRLAGDYEIVTRLIKIGHSFKLLPLVLVRYEGGGLSETLQEKTAAEINLTRNRYAQNLH